MERRDTSLGSKSAITLLITDVDRIWLRHYWLIFPSGSVLVRRYPPLMQIYWGNPIRMPWPNSPCLNFQREPYPWTPLVGYAEYILEFYGWVTPSQTFWLRTFMPCNQSRLKTGPASSGSSGSLSDPFVFKITDGQSHQSPWLAEDSAGLTWICRVAFSWPPSINCARPQLPPPSEWYP